MRFYSGLSALDDVVSGCGFCPGILEVFGGAASGKTSLTLSFMQDADQAGIPTLYVPTDETISPKFLQSWVPGCSFAKTLGDESAVEIALRFVRHGKCLVVIDSIHGLQPLAHNHSSLSYQDYSGRNRLLHYFLSSAWPLVQRTKSLLLVTSQIRDNIFEQGLRPKTVSSLTPNLRGLVDYSIRLTRKSNRAEYGRNAQSKVEARVVLDRFHHSGNRPSYIHMWHTHGFWTAFNLLTHMVHRGLIERHGAYFRDSGGVTLGPGWYKAAEAIERRLDFYKAYYRKSLDFS